MTTSVTTLPPDKKISHAKEMMKIKRFSGLPVVDAERRLLSESSPWKTSSTPSSSASIERADPGTDDPESGGGRRATSACATSSASSRISIRALPGRRWRERAPRHHQPNGHP
ncbi:MAG: CBS domain-containing protein [Comamonadaceae bacterium]|nr:CBS domain-containing protein [Comamonadaceae bacterium]